MSRLRRPGRARLDGSQSPGGVDLSTTAQSLEEFGRGGGHKVGPCAEAGVVGFGFFVEDEACVGEELGGFVETFEHILLDVVLLEKFFEGVSLLEFGVVRHASPDIDVCRDPVAAAFVQDFADELAELLFFFFAEVHEEAFVDDNEGAWFKAVDDGLEGGGVEGVEGEEFVVAAEHSIGREGCYKFLFGRDKLGQVGVDIVDRVLGCESETAK